MFKKARLKLTAWYLFIIMLISISFSLAIYQVLTFELNRVERVQRLRQQSLRRPAIDPEVIEESKNRLMATLTLINLTILAGSSMAGYFLAGRTLKPIKEMVDEQTRFITDSSHELRTPLTSLKSEIEVNLRDKNLNLNQAKRLLQSNLEEVNNLQYLSDNLIKLTKYQKNDRNFEIVDLAEIIKEAEKKITNLAKDNKITIKTAVKSLEINGDRQGLVELFVILLDNAIKYSPKNKTVALSYKKIDGFLEINITDQGIGIDEADLPHLFDRFYRADKSRAKSETSGYGLGLSIARQIVDEHRGLIKVESKIKKGSQFTIQLPI